MDFQASTGQMGGCWVAKRLKAKGKREKVESGKLTGKSADCWLVHSPRRLIS